MQRDICCRCAVGQFRAEQDAFGARASDKIINVAIVIGGRTRTRKSSRSAMRATRHLASQQHAQLVHVHLTWEPLPARLLACLFVYARRARASRKVEHLF